MNNAIFRERLREVIKNSGMTTDELACSARISPSTLQKYLKKNGVPSTRVILKLKESLNFEIDWLLGRK